jgi:hypothetical protein
VALFFVALVLVIFCVGLSYLLKSSRPERDRCWCRWRAVVDTLTVGHNPQARKRGLKRLDFWSSLVVNGTNGTNLVGCWCVSAKERLRGFGAAL